MNISILEGSILRDADYENIQKDKDVYEEEVSFEVCIKSVYKDVDEYKTHTSFVPVLYHGDNALEFAKALKKERKVRVIGSIISREEYNEYGNRKTKVYIEADKIEFPYADYEK